MDLEPKWKRIAGLHTTENGHIAVVWLAYEKETDKARLYCSAVFRRNEPMASVAEGIGAMGKWIPIAWEGKSKSTQEMLYERGLNLLPDPLKEDDRLREHLSKEIYDRYKSKRMLISRRDTAEWQDEFKTYFRDGQEGQVPTDSHPLMTATRYAIAQLKNARRLEARGTGRLEYPKVAIV